MEVWCQTNAPGEIIMFEYMYFVINHQQKTHTCTLNFSFITHRITKDIQTLFSINYVVKVFVWKPRV